MTEKNVLDLREKLLQSKINEGVSYVCCDVCASQESGFAVRGRFNNGGAYYITEMVCLNPSCLTVTKVEGGFVV